MLRDRFNGRFARLLGRGRSGGQIVFRQALADTSAHSDARLQIALVAQSLEDFHDDPTRDFILGREGARRRNGRASSQATAEDRSTQLLIEPLGDGRARGACGKAQHWSTQFSRIGSREWTILEL